MHGRRDAGHRPLPAERRTAVPVYGIAAAMRPAHARAAGCRIAALGRFYSFDPAYATYALRGAPCRCDRATHASLGGVIDAPANLILSDGFGVQCKHGPVWRRPGMSRYDRETGDMAKKLVRVHFDAAQWAAVDAAIDAIEQVWDPMLVALDADMRTAPKMGNRTEAFCRGAHHAMHQNPGKLPRELDVDEMGRCLASHDELALRRTRIARLFAKLDDTDTALGIDVMSAALHGYASLKLHRQADGLDGLRRDLGRHFRRPKRRKTDEATAQA